MTIIVVFDLHIIVVATIKECVIIANYDCF